ncbi:hypothetical protein O5O45_16415 [Hahella aquimaris]|uniref:hypothetical protein n=1 Tax=Hahella sp. HNIBRBA332 TaxID=3015983 RepID=UPI00273C2C0E|nr:hypothetical protein [Hahella sp. HNIBRBA332]WLQ11330.1 hypothetical protein O5O45_16415 [Hahella sp. HNIBRBA332]
MQVLEVDGLTFEFPKSWVVSKCDEWSFYRKQFSKMWNGIKSLDILAIGPGKEVWLIEVKDYRLNVRTKPSHLHIEIAEKVFDTLALILPCRLNSNNLKEREVSHFILGAQKLRVALHLEQPRKSSKLRPRAINPADVQQKLRKMLKPIDAHPLVVEISKSHGMPWSVK